MTITIDDDHDDDNILDWDMVILRNPNTNFVYGDRESNKG